MPSALVNLTDERIPDGPKGSGGRTQSIDITAGSGCDSDDLAARGGSHFDGESL